MEPLSEKFSLEASFIIKFIVLILAVRAGLHLAGISLHVPVVDHLAAFAYSLLINFYEMMRRLTGFSIPGI